MEVLGWDINSPYNTIETARKAVTQVSGDSLRQLLDSWNRLNAKGYRNLKDFIQHVQQLRDTLQNHGHSIEDNTAILNVLSAIESVDPSWVHLLEHDYTCGNLSWSKLTSLCMAKGNIQSTRSAYAPIIESDESRLPAKFDIQLKCEKCGKFGYAQKDCWNCNGTTNQGSFKGRGGATKGRGRGRGQSLQDGSKPVEMDTSSSLPRSATTQPPSLPSSQSQLPQQSQQPQQQDSNDRSDITVSEGLMKWRTGNTALRNLIDERDTWIADLGCDGHVTNGMKWYTDYTEFATPRMIGGHSSEPTFAWGSWNWNSSSPCSNKTWRKIRIGAP